MSKQIVWTLLVRLLLIAAGFLSSIVTARFLGPEGRGVFFYWTTLAAFAIQFGNLGLHSSNTYLLTKGHARLSALAANSLWVSVAGGLVLGGALIIYIYFTNGLYVDDLKLILPTVFLIPAGLYFLFATNLLVADGRIGEYNAFELVSRYIVLFAMLFAAWYWRTPQALLIVVSLLALLVCLPLYIRLQNIDALYGLNLNLFRVGFTYSIRAYLATALGFIVLRANIFFLHRYSDSIDFGIWSIAMQMMDVLIVIPSTVALVLLPRLMRSDQSYRLMSTQVGIVAWIMLCLCIIVILFANQVIVFVYGENFEPAYNMILCSLPGVFALGLISIISQYLASEGMPLSLVIIWLVGAISQLIFAFLLVPGYGGLGAMISLSVSYVLILVMIWLLASKYNRKTKIQKNI